MGSAFAQTPMVQSHPLTPTDSSAPIVENTLSPQNWQELRVARQAVLKAHPELSAKALQLSTKMRAFQVKLNAAIIKEDPKLEPIVAKLDNVHPSQLPKSAPPK